MLQLYRSIQFLTLSVAKLRKGKPFSALSHIETSTFICDAAAVLWNMEQFNRTDLYRDMPSCVDLRLRLFRTSRKILAVIADNRNCDGIFLLSITTKKKHTQ